MIAYFIIVVLIIIVYFRYRDDNTEFYNNYKSVTITPNKHVYDPYFINSNNSLVSGYISRFLSQNFPVKTNVYKSSNYDVIEKSKNGVIITTLYDFLKYTENNDTNLKFMLHLFNQKLTIISKNTSYRNLSDLDNEDLYIYSKNSSEYYILMKLKKYYKYRIRILRNNKYIDDLKQVFKDNPELNHIAMFTHHPNKTITNFIKLNNYPILNIDGLDYKVLSLVINNFKSDSIDSSYYYKYRNDMIKTLDNPMILVSDKNIDQEFIKTIIEFIYKNFMLVKNTKDNDIKNIIKYFNVSDIFASQTELYDIHPGIVHFYKKYGYISEKDLNICRKIVSIKSCDDSIRLNPYRLL